jgi:hypothetical protein
VGKEDINPDNQYHVIPAEGVNSNATARNHVHNAYGGEGQKDVKRVVGRKGRMERVQVVGRGIGMRVRVRGRGRCKLAREGRSRLAQGQRLSRFPMIT